MGGGGEGGQGTAIQRPGVCVSVFWVGAVAG